MQSCQNATAQFHWVNDVKPETERRHHLHPPEQRLQFKDLVGFSTGPQQNELSSTQESLFQLTNNIHTSKGKP